MVIIISHLVQAADHGIVDGHTLLELVSSVGVAASGQPRYVRRACETRVWARHHVQIDATSKVAGASLAALAEAVGKAQRTVVPARLLSIWHFSVGIYALKISVVLSPIIRADAKRKSSRT